MRVQHNIPALNAYRNYTNNTKAINKNLEKLSSGYRINRAGDDAAGLAISEKMRAQITGLATAQKNAKDGISLIQTAEGALTEVHSMLNRMFELAEQSANGTYDNEVDRANLQKEFDALRSEIDRIADSSNFNGTKLLNGSLDSTKKIVNEDLTISSALTAPGSTDGLGTNTILHQDSPAAAKTEFSVDLHDISVSLAAGNTFTLKVGDQTLTLTASATPTDTDGTDGGIDVGVGSYDGKALAEIIKNGFGSGSVNLKGADGNNEVFNVTSDGSRLTFTQNAAPKTKDDVVEGSGAVTLGGSGTLNIGGSTSSTGSHNINHTAITQGAAPGSDILASTAITLDNDMIQDGNTITLGNTTYTIKTDKDNSASGSNVIDLTDMAGASSEDKLNALCKRLTAAASDNAVFTVGYDKDSAGVITLVENKGQSVADLTNVTDFQKNVQLGVATPGQGKGLSLQIGDTSDSYNQLSVSVGDMHCESLGLSAVNIDKQGLAQTAMDAIKNAINSVSSTRGDLGALQNRLDHTINNLSVMEENITDAESTIRDTDVAKEMMAYTKNNILIQASQAMLAQANQLPQGVLQLMG